MEAVENIPLPLNLSEVTFPIVKCWIRSHYVKGNYVTMTVKENKLPMSLIILAATIDVI